MISRRNFFRAAASAGLAAVVGPEASRGTLPPEFFDTTSAALSGDVLTFADIQRAEAMLNEHNAPPFADGHYRMFLHPIAAEDIALDSMTINASYRVRETAWSLMQHERRREAMGKRGHVTAAEVFARVAEKPVEPVAVACGVVIETCAC